MGKGQSAGWLSPAPASAFQCQERKSPGAGNKGQRDSGRGHGGTVRIHWPPTCGRCCRVGVPRLTSRRSGPWDHPQQLLGTSPQGETPPAPSGSQQAGPCKRVLALEFEDVTKSLGCSSLYPNLSNCGHSLHCRGLGVNKSLQLTRGRGEWQGPG